MSKKSKYHLIIGSETISDSFNPKYPNLLIVNSFISYRKKDYKIIGKGYGSDNVIRLYLEPVFQKSKHLIN